MSPPRFCSSLRAHGPTRVRGAGRLTLVAALAFGGMAAASDNGPFTFHPVNDLRLALQIPVTDHAPHSKDLTLRRQTLERRVGALCRAPELREALLLTEWRDEDIDPLIAAVDRAVRAEVARRFELAVREVLQRGAPASRLAAANMLREVAATVRSNSIAGATLERFGPLLA